MPIKIPDSLPAYDTLKAERVKMMRASRAETQDIRPLKIAILNLMPDKIRTETQLLRALGTTPLQLDVTLLRTDSYLGKNTPEEHLLAFYKTFYDVRHEKFDGLIITGAPVEHMDYEDVAYWQELTDIMDWAETNCFGKFFICWGAQAALYHHYDIQKDMKDAKLFGMYKHKVPNIFHPLVNGFDDYFSVPVSRNTGIDETAVAQTKDLEVLAHSEITGTGLIYSQAKRSVYMFNHLEYDADTLRREYERDSTTGVSDTLPHDYFPDNNPDIMPPVTWRAHRTLLFGNWINMIYQGTPFDLDKLFAYIEKNPLEND